MNKKVMEYFVALKIMIKSNDKYQKCYENIKV